MDAWKRDRLYSEIRRRVAERPDGRLRRHWGWGLRFFAGRWADAYLERRPPQPGTAVVTFRCSRHVADPCDFTDEELTGYWSDVRTAAKAIERAGARAS